MFSSSAGTAKAHQKAGCQQAGLWNSLRRWGPTVLPPPPAPTRAAIGLLSTTHLPLPGDAIRPFLRTRLGRTLLSRWHQCPSSSPYPASMDCAAAATSAFAPTHGMGIAGSPRR
jgi:hypothetical protein